MPPYADPRALKEKCVHINTRTFVLYLEEITIPNSPSVSLCVCVCARR